MEITFLIKVDPEFLQWFLFSTSGLLVNIVDSLLTVYMLTCIHLEFN